VEFLTDYSRESQIAIAASILLPYGTVTVSTMIFTTNQYWLFPLWTYLHDFGNWLEFGVIIPPFLPSFSYLLSILGVIFLILGLYFSRALNQVLSGQRERKSLQIRVLCYLFLQIISTIFVSLTMWGVSVVLIIPLPFQSLIVLYLSRHEAHLITEPFEH